MIGLEYICKASNIDFKTVAEKLDIKPQTINSWLRGKRPIPEIRLTELQGIFSVPKEYFQRELTEADKVEIDIFTIQKNMSKIKADINTLPVSEGRKLSLRNMIMNLFDDMSDLK